MVFDNILEALGNTPLVRLNRVCEPESAQILVKFEGVNIGGSVKTRTAYQMIVAAQRAGAIDPSRTIVVEPTSGNQGIGLALVCAVLGYRARVIMPDSVSVERRKLVSHYGAEVVIVHDEGDIGKCISECIEIAKRMAAEDPNVFVPQQFDNPNNIAAHSDQTATEILSQYSGPIHGFCSGIGTGGTITGVGHTLRERHPGMEIWALEPEGAAILSGGTVGSHVQMGIGDGIVPGILDTDIYDGIEVVTDEEALKMARRLAREEGLMCGISSGTNVVGAVRLAKRLGPGKTVVTILPDTAERYFSTPLFDGE